MADTEDAACQIIEMALVAGGSAEFWSASIDNHVWSEIIPCQTVTSEYEKN
jgi:hypothetical protein